MFKRLRTTTLVVQVLVALFTVLFSTNENPLDHRKSSLSALASPNRLVVLAAHVHEQPDQQQQPPQQQQRQHQQPAHQHHYQKHLHNATTSPSNTSSPPGGSSGTESSPQSHQHHHDSESAAAAAADEHTMRQHGRARRQSVSLPAAQSAETNPISGEQSQFNHSSVILTQTNAQLQSRQHSTTLARGDDDDQHQIGKSIEASDTGGSQDAGQWSLIVTNDANKTATRIGRRALTDGLNRRHAAVQELNPDCEFQTSRKPAIYGLRCDDSEVTEDGSIIVRAFSATRIYVIGRNLYSNLTVAITEQEGANQDDCTHADRIKSLRLYNLSLNIGEIIVELPPPEKSVPYYFCIREDTHDSRWYHQGSEPWLRIHIQQDFMPLWAKIITIIVLLSMSGLFSGLNLGLMALDKNELQVIMKCGTEEEKRYATAIEPVRRRGNYLLCSILFSNTLVNSTISVFLEDLSDGLVAIMTSTVLIVLFGEILPQAFCSRHGLAVGARTIWLTHFCMWITFPLSYPVSYCLDWALGEEIGHAYDRERLMEFIQVTRDINNLEADEVNIISGALKIKRVQISEVMTRIEDVYMLDENSVLDFDTIQAIVGKGYSRIPVHEAGNRRNIKAVLFAKDLALVDPDDRTPVQTMINFYNHPRMFVFEDTTLDKALNEFKTGRSHMAIVQKVTDDGDRDPYYEVTGIVTLEDVIEEIMQMEINDETDTLTDNRRKRRRKDAQVRKDFSQFTNLGTGDSSFNVVTPQLCLAAYQYLATTVEPFTPKYLSDSILRRLLSQRIFYKVRLEDDPAIKRLYTAGEPADYFIMILEGRVHVICGKENLVFDGGPFSFFGKAALTQLDQGDSMTITAPVPAGPVTPGGSIGGQILAANTSSGSVRKDSTRHILSRRESLAKIVTSQLSLATGKKQTTEQQEQVAVAESSSPTGSAKVGPGLETVELIEHGSYYFKPDYTVDIIANTSYLKVTRNDYITALRATCVEREGAALLGEDIETTFIMDSYDQQRDS